MKTMTSWAWFAVSALGPAAFSQCDETKIVSPSGGLFGFKSEASGDRVVFSNPTDHTHDGGASYVYRQEGAGWVLEAVLVGGDTRPLDSAGRGVAMDGDRVVVGAPSHDADGELSAGAAYVFVDTGNGWVEEKKLVAPTAVEGALLGENVAIDGDVIVLGAYQYEVAGVESGAALVYRHDGTTWRHEALLQASDAVALDHFGYDVAVQGDVIVVGARNREDGVGAVYFFRRQGGSWQEEGRIGGLGRNLFGWSVDLDGNTAVVGTPNAGQARGLVTVIEHDGREWRKVVDLPPSTARPMLSMGWSIDIEGDVIVAGAPERSIYVRHGPGAAFVFRRVEEGWVEATELLASDGFVNMWLGQAVALTEDTIIAGTLFGSRAYSWSLIPDRATATTYGEGLPGRLGVPSIDAPSPPVLGGEVVVQIGNSRGQSTFGLVFLGRAPAEVPALGGTILVDPDFIIPVTLPAAGLTLQKSVPCDLALSGFLHYLQTLMLDPAADRGVSFTQGLQKVYGW